MWLESVLFVYLFARYWTNHEEGTWKAMYSPVTRLLTVLDLLQARPQITAELAQRLQVNTRSIRRYITQLQDLGIPVEAERGSYGGYRLRPGFKLPPLMWTEEEALAVTLGLRTVQQLGLTSAVPAVVSALAKVERVLPKSLQERVQAVQETVVFDFPPSPTPPLAEYILTLSQAAYHEQQIEIDYQASDGKPTRRVLDCYSVVYHSGYWYAIGYCHLRQGMRTFRLDRVLRIERSSVCFQRPRNFDGLAYVLQAFATIPARWYAEILLDTTLQQARWAVPPAFAVLLEERHDGILLRLYDDDLAHLARYLMGLGCPFHVLQPRELLEALRQLAENTLRVVTEAKLFRDAPS
jgi:predicted DNA-binding transcriptional regulator YafY